LRELHHSKKSRQLQCVLNYLSFWREKWISHACMYIQTCSGNTFYRLARYIRIIILAEKLTKTVLTTELCWPK
jgi:hypothetical protein